MTLKAAQSAAKMSMSDPPRRSSRSNKGQHSAPRWAVDENQPQDVSASKRQKKSSSNEPELDSSAEDGEINCRCGIKEQEPGDERTMVECEKCLKWQHVVCMIGVDDESQLHDPYKCFVCEPRKELKATSEETNGTDDQTPSPNAGSDGGQSKAEKTEDSHNGSEPTDPSEASSQRTIKNLKDKVRNSVATALERIFSRQLVPMAIEEGTLRDIDQPSYAEQLALDIEQAMFDHFVPAQGKKAVDVGPEYRRHFRTLSFNLKDNKNHGLQTRIVTRNLSPMEAATLSSEQMLSPYLQKLAASVRQESIRDSVLKVDEAPRMRKTHKGDEFIESEETENAAPMNEVTAGAIPGRKESDTKSSSNTPQHITQVNYDQGSAFDDISYSPTHQSDFDDFHNSGSEEDIPNVDLDQGQESDDSLSELVAPASPGVTRQAVWTGQVSMTKVAEFPGTCFHLGRNTFKAEMWNLAFDVTKPLVIEGRLAAPTAEQYLKTVSQTRLIASFVLASDEPTSNFPEYEKLFNYFHSRHKFGVLPNHKAIVKDAYLVPLTRTDPVPEYLGLSQAESDLLNGFRKEGNCLLGVYVLPPASALLKQ